MINAKPRKNSFIRLEEKLPASHGKTGKRTGRTTPLIFTRSAVRKQINKRCRTPGRRRMTQWRSCAPASLKALLIQIRFAFTCSNMQSVVAVQKKRSLPKHSKEASGTQVSINHSGINLLISGLRPIQF